MGLARGIDRKSALITFVIGGWVMSELGWIIRTENKRADFDRQTKAEIQISRSIIDRLNRGEKVDVQKELLGKYQSKPEEEASVESILSSLDSVDTKWSEATPSVKRPTEQPPKKGGWI